MREQLKGELRDHTIQRILEAGKADCPATAQTQTEADSEKEERE